MTLACFVPTARPDLSTPAPNSTAQHSKAWWAQHLYSWCGYSKGKPTLYYWQIRSQSEVDFVIYGESGLFAFEVKNSRRVDQGDLTALKHFAEDYADADVHVRHRRAADLDVFSKAGVLG